MSTIERLLFVVFVMALIVAPILAGGPDQKIEALAEKGPYEVGFSFYTLVDTNREGPTGTPGSPIPVALWYPVDPKEINGAPPKALYQFDPFDASSPLIDSIKFEDYGIDPTYEGVPISTDAPFPLVVFSPGWRAWYFIHVSVGTRLASHGFVVAVLTHYGDGSTPSDAFVHISLAAMHRPLDISFFLDDILDRNTIPSDPLFNLVQPEKIAASGWSLGGYGAMALAAGDDEVCDLLNFPIGGLPPTDESCVPILPDERIKVIVTLDGSNQVLHFDELARIKVPAMGIGRPWETVVDWQARQHAAIQGHPSYRVDISDTHHVTFSDYCVSLPILRDEGILDPGYVEAYLQNLCDPYLPFALLHPMVKRYMLAFLKTNLVGESGYQNMLTPGWAINNEPFIEFFVTEKRNPNAIDQDWPDISIYFQNQPGPYF